MTVHPVRDDPEQLRETLADLVSREQFGQNVRFARRIRGLSLRDVTDRSHLSAQAISRVELGQRTPNARTLVGIAAALGLEFSVDGSGIRIVDPHAGLVDDEEE